MVCKKKKKTLIWIISGTIGLFLIIGGGFFIYRSNFAKIPNSFSNSPPKQKNLPPPIPKPPPSQKWNPTPEINEKTKQLIEKWKFLLKTNPKLVPVPDDYIGQLLEKGYNDAGDIRKLFDWKIAASDIPDLNSTTRIGVTKTLSVTKEGEKIIGGKCDDLVVIVRKKSASQNQPTINIDGRIFAEGKEYRHIQELITAVLTWENQNPNQWEVSCLYANADGPFFGTSGGTAFYLALISAIHKKPLPNNLASTGEIKINEKKVSAIGGLPDKIDAAFEKRTEILVLPESNKNFFKFETKNKNKPPTDQPQPEKKATLHFVDNCQQLRDLVFQNKLN